MIPQFLTLACAAVQRRCGSRSASGTRTGTPTVRCGSRRALASVVLSVDRRSFPLESPKVRGIGHAIDVGAFRLRPGRSCTTARCACSRSAG